MVPVGSSVMLELVLAVDSYHVIAYLAYEVFVQMNDLICSFCLRAEIISSCFEATKLPNLMRFHQQTSKQYVCREKIFVIFGTIYRLHRLVMMSQLMWIPPKFGQVSHLMRFF